MTERKKLDKKKALEEIQICLGFMESQKEQIKSIKDQLKEDYNKETADSIEKLAKLMENDKFHTEMEKAQGLENLYDELFSK